MTTKCPVIFHLDTVSERSEHSLVWCPTLPLPRIPMSLAAILKTLHLSTAPRTRTRTPCCAGGIKCGMLLREPPSHCMHRQADTFEDADDLAKELEGFVRIAALNTESQAELIKDKVRCHASSSCGFRCALALLHTCLPTCALPYHSRRESHPSLHLFDPEHRRCWKRVACERVRRG
jgi:hypothetical protein